MGIRFRLVLSYVVAGRRQHNLPFFLIAPPCLIIAVQSVFLFFLPFLGWFQRRMPPRHCVLASGRDKRKVRKVRSQKTWEIGSKGRKKHSMAPVLLWRSEKRTTLCSKLVKLDVTFIRSSAASAAHTITIVCVVSCVTFVYFSFAFSPYDRPHRKWNGNVIDVNVSIYLQRLTSVIALTTRSCQNSKHTQLI